MDTRTFSSFDGTRLAAQAFGRGDLPVVLANGLGGNTLAWAPLTDEFTGRCRFHSWDYRGLYASGLAPSERDYTISHHARDLVALMDWSGLRDAVVVGWSMGVQVALEAARQHPGRVRALVLLNGTYGRAFHTAFDHRLSRHVMPIVNNAGLLGARGESLMLKGIVRAGLAYRFYRSLGLIAKQCDRALFDSMAADVASLDMRRFHIILRELDRHDASAVLPQLTVPVLILAGEKDVMTPPKVTHRMIHDIRHAHLDIIPGASHYMLLEQPGIVRARFRTFLDEHFPAAPPPAQNDGTRPAAGGL